jgi:hypothetical protein
VLGVGAAEVEDDVDDEAGACARPIAPIVIARAAPKTTFTLVLFGNRCHRSWSDSSEPAGEIIGTRSANTPPSEGRRNPSELAGAGVRPMATVGASSSPTDARRVSSTRWRATVSTTGRRIPSRASERADVAAQWRTMCSPDIR